MKRTYIKASEVVARIREIQEEQGDLPVKICLPGLPKKPTISGIRIVKNSKQNELTNIDIVPQYDIRGYLTEASSANTIAYQVATTQTMFQNFAKGLFSVKEILENYKIVGKKTFYNGREVDLVPTVRGDFIKLFETARAIEKGINSLAGFDKRLAQVVKEPFHDEHYAAAYSHGIDINLSDTEFAKAITDGIGEKTSVQRLAVYIDIMRKINAEIESRRKRIAQLDKRIRAEKTSNEGLNAKVLKTKSLGIIETLAKRRKYILDRYTALKDSIVANIGTMTDEIETLASA